MEFKAEPYTLRLSPNSPKSELDFRENLNFSWCNSVLFNVEAIDNRATVAEFDAILWNEMEKAILFMEYKDSSSAKKNMKGHRAQQVKGISRNIARAFGFRWYNFIIVVNSTELSKEKKGDAAIVLMTDLKNYKLIMNEEDNPIFKNDENSIEFESTLEELNLVDRIIDKYNRQENPAEFNKELVLGDLKILRTKIEQLNR
jgi:hypothetical protein